MEAPARLTHGRKGKWMRAASAVSPSVSVIAVHAKSSYSLPGETYLRPVWTSHWKALVAPSDMPVQKLDGSGYRILVIDDDLGHSGTGGALSDTHIVNLTVNPVNDAPAKSKSNPAAPSIEK